MRKTAFRPTLWMSVFTALAFVILLALGTWQVQRLGWKRDLINRIETRMAADPISLPVAFSGDLKYVPVRLRGKFIDGKRDYVFGQSYKGRTGYSYLQPFQTDDARQIIVNRGWVPEQKRAPESWPRNTRDAAHMQPQEIVGMLRPGGWQGSKIFRPANDPNGDSLIFVEPGLIAKRLNLPDPEPFYVDQIHPENPGGLPLIIAAKREIPNNHLQYALTWYAFAFILLIIFIIRARRPVEDPPC